MAYPKFKVSSLEEQFNIITLFEDFILGQLPIFSASDWLLQALEDNKWENMETEKAKSELIITPILKELHKKNRDKCAYFSGYEFNVDKRLALNGFCDFILSAVPKSPIIKAPVFCIVEAKKGIIEDGYGQCGAEMYAAYIFNERQGNPQKIIYGCVTNAFTWSFLKLENNVLFIDPRSVQLSLTNPHQVLSVLQWIVDEVKSPE
jgi:hypothetical protein